MSADVPETLEQQATAGSWCAAKAVFDKNCVGCHDGKGTGGSPMGLTKPADFSANAPLSAGKKVSAAVSARIHDTARPMPPRGIMPAADLKAVDDWIRAGMPAGGDPTCGGGGTSKPAAAWPLPECDEVYDIRAHGAGTSPYMVPAGGEIHPQITVNPPWGSQQVQAIAWNPLTDNAKVLHHWILYNGLAFLTGWAPGDEERPPFPKDVGMDMPTAAGSLRLDMHYFNTTGTKAEPDRSGVSICVVKGAHLRRNHAAVTMSFNSFGPVLAPANNRNFNSTGTCNVRTTQPVHLMTAAPHAHKLAKHMKFVVRKKNGQTITMHDQPFKFGEQGTYGLSPEVIVETGDVVTTTCTFDNPTSRAVTFGESTNNEMCFNFAMYYPKGGLSCSFGF